jgi:hypothetical protein
MEGVVVRTYEWDLLVSYGNRLLEITNEVDLPVNEEWNSYVHKEMGFR